MHIDNVKIMSGRYAAMHPQCSPELLNSKELSYCYATTLEEARQYLQSKYPYLDWEKVIVESEHKFYRRKANKCSCITERCECEHPKKILIETQFFMGFDLWD
jgi:hypothetical protein